MAFADAADVGIRLGRALTDEETATAELIIELVEGLIADAVGENAAWVTGLSPVPGVLRVLCIEKAVAAISNPSSAASWSEQLGQWQRSETYPRAADVGLFLSETEQRLARRAAGLAPSASSRPASLVGDFHPED